MTNPPNPIDDLLPCPFCGGEALISGFSGKAALQIVCVDCLLVMNAQGEKNQDTFDRWNQRQPQTKSDDE